MDAAAGGVSELPEFVDFESAEEFLRQARAAHQAGDRTLYIAACKLVAVALYMTETAGVCLHTRHLKA